MDRELLRKNFEKRGFSVRFFDTKEEAKQYFVEKFDRRSIGFGGSATLREMGLFEALSEKNAVVWHNYNFSNEIKDLASHAKVYICSANGVAETGQIVNIDGAGNRLAMTLYGPDELYFVIGRNKVVPDLDAALWRAKNIATPKNCQRFGVKTPCAVKGDKCYNCDSPAKMCRLTLIMDGPSAKAKTELVFIDEDLGF